MSRLAGELAEVAAAVAALDADGIERFVDLLEETQRAGRTVFLAGNGGSAANASHFTQDLRNAAPHGHLDVRNLSDNVPVITAIANDRGFERIFDLQIEGSARSGDLLVAFSCSGNSDNVLNAVNAARELGVRVVGLTAFDGGALRQRCDLSLHVPLEDFGKSEAVHAVIVHLAAASLARRLAEAGEPGGDALVAAARGAVADAHHRPAVAEARVAHRGLARSSLIDANRHSPVDPPSSGAIPKSGVWLARVGTPRPGSVTVSESSPFAVLDQGWREARAANVEGEFARLEGILTRVLPLAERLHGADSPEVERALQELAYAHRRQGKYLEVIPVLRRLVELQEHLHGPNHSGLGLSLDLLAAAVSRAHPDRMSEVKKLETRAAHIRLRRRR